MARAYQHRNRLEAIYTRHGPKFLKGLPISIDPDPRTLYLPQADPIAAPIFFFPFVFIMLFVTLNITIGECHLVRRLTMSWLATPSPARSPACCRWIFLTGRGYVYGECTWEQP